MNDDQEIDFVPLAQPQQAAPETLTLDDEWPTTRYFIKQVMVKFDIKAGEPISSCLEKLYAGASPQAAAPAGQAAVVPLTSELVRELMADTREVFSADRLGTPQDVRDVIEYMGTWLTVFLEKRQAAR